MLVYVSFQLLLCIRNCLGPAVSMYGASYVYHSWRLLIGWSILKNTTSAESARSGARHAGKAGDPQFSLVHLSASSQFWQDHSRRGWRFTMYVLPSNSKVSSCAMYMTLVPGLEMKRTGGWKKPRKDRPPVEDRGRPSEITYNIKKAGGCPLANTETALHAYAT